MVQQTLTHLSYNSQVRYRTTENEFPGVRTQSLSCQMVEEP